MKNFIFILSTCTLAFISISRAQEESFCYDEGEPCGPEHWEGQCNSGTQQSPLNLNFTYNDANRAPRDDLYANREYSRLQDFYLNNNGNTVQASINRDLTSSSVTYGRFLGGGKYVFSQVHFHWGSRNGDGSEHAVNGRFYDLEAHLVHYDSNYRNLTEAVASGQKGAVAVFGILFQVSDQDNRALNPILRAMRQTRRQGESGQGQGLYLPGIFPSDRFHVIQYEGSLTTPGCEEVVLWNEVFPCNYLSENQLSQFRNLLRANNRALVNNYRQIQPTNDRPVKFYYVRAHTY